MSISFLFSSSIKLCFYFNYSFIFFYKCSSLIRSSYSSWCLRSFFTWVETSSLSSYFTLDSTTFFKVGSSSISFLNWISFCLIYCYSSSCIRFSFFFNYSSIVFCKSFSWILRSYSSWDLTSLLILAVNSWLSSVLNMDST
jgi:hypothetical protein